VRSLDVIKRIILKLYETGYDSDWIQRAQERTQWRVIVNTIRNFAFNEGGEICL
jgi:hypothetical protein